MTEEIHDFGTTIIITDKATYTRYEIRKYSSRLYIVYCGKCGLHINKRLEHMQITKSLTHHKNKHGSIVTSNRKLQDVYLCPHCIRALKARKMNPKALLALLKLKEILW